MTTLNVVDSSGWIEYFTNSPGADNFAPALDHPEQLLVPSLSIHEVAKWILREFGEDQMLQCIAVMHQGQVAELTAELALNAARLGLEWRLPTADSIMLATARQHQATLWTQDADFREVPSVRYFPKTSG